MPSYWWRPPVLYGLHSVSFPAQDRRNASVLRGVIDVIRDTPLQYVVRTWSKPVYEIFCTRTLDYPYTC